MQSLIQSEIVISHGGELALFRRGYISEKEVRRIKTVARFDKGKFRLAIGESLKEILGLEIVDHRKLLWADDDEVFADVAEFVELHFENRLTIIQPFVLPDISDAFLGSFILQDLDVVIDNEKQSLIVNPETPHIARTYLKRNLC